MEKKRNYESPISESIEMEVNSVICESGGSGEGGWGDEPGDGPGIMPTNETADNDPWGNNK